MLTKSPHDIERWLSGAIRILAEQTKKSSQRCLIKESGEGLCQVKLAASVSSVCETGSF